MNWFRTILDGLAISAMFNCCVAVFWILKPHSFIVMFPKSLQKKARPVTKEERRHTILMYATLYPAILIWMILSTYQAGINCFWPMFWTSYIEMMFVLFAWDTFFLDWILFANIKRLRLPGTEHMNKEYHQKWFHVQAL